MPRDPGTAQMCPERLKLSTEVTNAVQKNYTAKAAHDRAKNKIEAGALAVELAAARRAELAVVAALDKHRKEHGC